MYSAYFTVYIVHPLDTIDGTSSLTSYTIDQLFIYMYLYICQLFSQVGDISDMDDISIRRIHPF